MGGVAKGHCLQETSIQDLSDDIMIDIMCHLSLRDVMNLSLATKQWSHLPACLNNIVVDIHMYRKGSKECTKDKDFFIKGINQYLDYYAKLRSKLALSVPPRMFVIDFCFTRQNSRDIDSWISMMTRTGIIILVVRLACADHRATFAHAENEKYIFPWDKVHNSPVLLKRLALRACNFACRLTSQWTSLLVLELYGTKLTKYDMGRISFCFPNLQKLVLARCEVPAKLSFTSGALFFLELWFCRGPKEIDLLGAKALTEFNYRGFRINLDSIVSPKLTNLRLGFFDVKGEESVFQNLRGDTVRSLSIFKECELPRLHSHPNGRMNSFLRLNELKLYSHPTYGISRQTVANILKACPVLIRLEMVPPCTFDDTDNDIESEPVLSLHKRLRFIKISGFCGSRANVEMAKFLIQVSEKLHHVVVESKLENIEYKNSFHGANWHGEEEPEAVKDLLLRFVKSGKLTFSCTQNMVQTSIVYKYQKLLKAFCLWCYAHM